jgi:ABC-type branched-subunit amino acid transport system substrate-binding protein
MRRGAALGVCALAFAAVTAGVSSCGAAAGSSSVTASGTALTIYSSAPTSDPASADLLDAQLLAFHDFQDAGGKVGKFTIKFARVGSTKVSDNARAAIENTGAIAYIGELQPGASADSMGITNSQDVLQVSPSDTAIELTQATSAVSGAPNSYYESQKTYGHTFARVVPNAAQEAKALVQEMSSLGVKNLSVKSDGSSYGAAIAQAVTSDAKAGGLIVVPSQTGADGIFFGGVSSSVSAFNSLAAANPGVKLFGSSALAAATPPSGDRNVYVSTPGFLPKDLPAAGKTFVTKFTSTYGHAPATEAIFGYEAMSAVLSVLQKAGANVSDRATVVHNFFAIRDRAGAIGTYSINSNGDVSIAPFVISRSVDGKLVPFRFVQVQG